jgi:hypothetical protein
MRLSDKTYKLDLHDVQYDEWLDVFEFKCPVCGFSFHSEWHSLEDEGPFDVGHEIACGKCDTAFVLVRLGAHVQDHDWKIARYSKERLTYLCPECESKVEAALCNGTERFTCQGPLCSWCGTDPIVCVRLHLHSGKVPLEWKDYYHGHMKLSEYKGMIG